MTNAIIEVYNVPEYASTQPYPYWVASIQQFESGENKASKLWFYGAYRRLERATEVAAEIGGVVVKRIEEGLE